MKLIIIISVVTWCYAAKLERTYLPPNRAQTSGGSGSFLQAPLSETAQPNAFGQTDASYNQNGNGFAQNGNGFAQNGNAFTQNGNGFAQNGNGFSDNANYNGFSNFEAKSERPQAAYERNAAILRENNENNGEAYSYAYETENGIYAEENGVATNGVEAQGGYSYTGDDGQVYSVRYTADQNGFVPQGNHLPTPPPVPEEILKALEQNARDEAAGIYDDGSYNEAKYNNDGNQYTNTGFGNNNGNAYPTDSDDTVVTNNALFRNQPETNNQGADSTFRNQGSNGFGNQVAGVNKAYLPPFATQGGSTQNGNGFARRPSFNARDGYRY